MSEDAALMARIAALAGRINQQRQGADPSTASLPSPNNRHSSPRWEPYGQRPQRPSPAHPPHRHRTLVVNNTTPNKKDAAGAHPTESHGIKPPGWVSTRDRGHLQLTNTAVYGQRAQEKQKAIEETARAKLQRRNEKQKKAVLHHVQQAQRSVAATVDVDAPRVMLVGGLAFHVAPDGSKLIRVPGERRMMTHIGADHLKLADGANKAQSTPKQVKIAGVLFHRSKTGNLLRSGLVKRQRYRTSPRESRSGQLTSVRRQEKTKKSTKLCPSFTSTGIDTFQTHLPGIGNSPIPSYLGKCARQHLLTALAGSCVHGDRCRNTHDIDKVAICKDFLRTGQCAAGEDLCDLSHNPTPHRVPVCTHFLRGNCTKPDCRYAHVHVNAAAPVCRDFATLGYCDKGADCTERHVVECPDYANTGTCRNTKCRLPHIDRAGNLRKAAALKARQGSEGSSDLSSDDEDDDQEIDSDDVDSDDMDDDLALVNKSGVADVELAQQLDFVPFS